MKNNEVGVLVFIGCIIIGILIAMNIDFTKISEWKILSTSQYQDLYTEKLKLQSDVDSLTAQYKTMSSKIKRYEKSNNASATVISDINKEIEKSKLDLGFTAVKGEGITFAVTDATEYFTGDSSADAAYIIHDFDILNILNDLKSAGAEAITINGQRILNTTFIFCSGEMITINGVDYPKPFVFQAIGNKEQLQSYMESDENYLKQIRYLRYIHWNIETVEDMTIPAYMSTIPISNVHIAQ